ncbi:MFS transporter [Caldisphaera sp.]|uniref:MFS transporter n=2 Tax=Caldisphaera sp. TaxID=2060322 RepID=UPI003D098DA2
MRPTDIIGLTFLRYFMSRNLLRLTSIMFYIYYMWILMVKYNSIFLVSLIPTTSLLGYLIILLPEGYILDRFSREKVMFYSSVFMSLVYFSLFIFHYLFWIYIVACLSSLLSNISSDIFSTLIKELVSYNNMSKAISLVEAGRGFSEILGIALGGISISFLSQYFVTLIAFLSFVSIILSIPKKIVTMNKTNKYGYKIIIKVIRIILGFLLIGMIINGLFISLDVYAAGLFHMVLHTNSVYYTLFLLGFSLGSFLGGLIGIKISRYLENVYFISLSIAFFGLCFLIISLSKVPIIDIGIVTILGLFSAFTNIPLTSKLIKIIPNEILGRVNSLATIFLASSSPIMALIYGFLAKFFPLTNVIFMNSILMFLLSLPTYYFLKDIFSYEENDIRFKMDH